MATVTVSEVRDRIDVALTSAGYTRSRHVPEMYGRDTDHLLPKSYSISVPATSIEDYDGRERYGDEGEAITTVDIRTAYRLRADDQSGDYGRALDHEHTVIRVILTDTDRTYIQVQIVGIPRRTVTPGGDWLISLIRLQVYHRYTFV